MRLRASVLQMMLFASVLSVSSSVPYHVCKSPMSFVGKSTCATKQAGEKFFFCGGGGGRTDGDWLLPSEGSRLPTAAFIGRDHRSNRSDAAKRIINNFGSPEDKAVERTRLTYYSSVG